MTGKYHNRIEYGAAWLRRRRWLAKLEPLVRWEPLAEVRDGYSIVLACNTPLAQMLGANLRVLERQSLRNLDRILVVFDRPSDQIAFPIEHLMREQFPSLPLHFIYYTQQQVDVLGTFRRPWVYCWLSWMLGIARARTRYCMLHDFDAMLLNPHAIEQRFEQIAQRRMQYCGVKNYYGNGVLESDELRVTFELMFDLEFVRRTFAPIELANRVSRYKGRFVDFDIFLYAQTVAGKGFVLEIPEEEMVHPQQMICQFTDLMVGRPAEAAGKNSNLLLIPYFMFVGGWPKLMSEIQEELQRITAVGSRRQAVRFFGKELDLSKMSLSHAQWLAKQAYRLEQAVAGQVREAVSGYFQALEGFLRWRGSAGTSEHSPAASDLQLAR